MTNTGVDIAKLKNYGTKDIDITETNIKKLHECDFLDFRQQWHEDNEELLYDILCLCNSISDVKKRYLIFGIKENSKTKHKKYYTVSKNAERKTDEMLENLLHEYFYIPPKISIFQLHISRRIIDVLEIIPDSSVLPYHLQKECKYKVGEQKNNKDKTIQKNTIYARNGNTNFPRNEGVPHYYIEQLFAIKHGQHLTTRERGFIYLNDIEQWLGNGNNEIFYDKDCAYKIVNDCENAHIQKLNEVPMYAYILQDTGLGTKYWESKKNILNCSVEEHYCCYNIKLLWHNNIIHSFDVIKILIKHYPLLGDLKIYYLPAGLYQYFHNKQRSKEDIFELIEYKICRILYNMDNSSGNNDNILAEINWDYLYFPNEYIKNNPWIYNKRE